MSADDQKHYKELIAVRKRAERMLDRFLPFAFKEYERMYPGEVDPADNYVAWEVQEARDVLAELERLA